MSAKAEENSWMAIGLRLIVGGVFIYAGGAKLLAPQKFADAIATFRLLPPQMINLLALGLPICEASLGGLLLLGVWLRTAALGALALCSLFALALASALLRGLVVDCGCFGGHGGQSTIGVGLLLVRDGLLAAAAWAIYLRNINSTNGATGR